MDNLSNQDVRNAHDNQDIQSKPAQTKKLPSPASFINIYLFIMFTFFPLFVTVYTDGQFPFIHLDDGFIGIRHQKYYFFMAATAIAVIAEFFLLILMDSNGSDKLKINKNSILKKLSFTDWAALALVLCCAISTVLSPHIEMAFWGEITVGGGTQGRNNGLILILFYVLIYFMITRLYRYAEFVFIGLACSCAIVYLLTVLNGFYIDPLNMFANFRMQKNIYMEFFATIGNKNMLSSFICITLPALFTMSVVTKKLSFRIIYLVSVSLGAMAFIIDDSDSGLLGIAVFLAVFLVVFIRRPDRLKYYFLTLTVFLASIKVLRLFSYILEDSYKKLGKFPLALMLSNKLYIVIAASAIITVILFLISKSKPGLVLPKAVPIVLGALFGIAALGVLGTFIYFSFVDTKTPLGDWEKTLRFGPKWGTHRGIMWIRAFDVFGGADFIHKLFGYGPDTFYYLYEPYFTELQKYGNTSTDAAHNEYINYLVTIGIAGLTSYLAFVGGALVRGFKSAKRNPVVLAFAAAVIGYAAQAVVNIAVPISTPLFIIFVSLCEAMARQRDVGRGGDTANPPI